MRMSRLFSQTLREAPADAEMPSPTLGSAPIPPAAEPQAAKPPSPPLGSAPIPPMEPAKPAKVIPPKPPVDIEFGATDAATEAAGGDSDGPEEDEFSQTVVIPPPNGAGEKKTEPPRNSTDEFISRVKQQLATSGSKPDADTEQDSFTSTIPQ